MATTTTPPQTTHSLAEQGTGKKDRKRVWCVLRIVDYRVQALAPADPDAPEAEQEWADLGSDSTCSTDREAMYQLARNHNGLLVSAAGIPAAGRLSRFLDKARALENA